MPSREPNKPQRSATAASADWKRVWEARSLSSQEGSILGRLLAADGYDTEYAEINENSWIEFVDRWAAKLEISSQHSVFEVGCGAGAFLYGLYCKGCTVGGIDWSTNLVNIAKSAMPTGDFGVKEAANLDALPSVDVVFACSVFAYFPSLDYASQVIEQMVAKTTHAVAILDLPDRASEDAALNFRKASVGTENYVQRYANLDHRYYDRDWITKVLSTCGLKRVETSDQDLANYGNAAYRFNALGFKS